jgi:hypothetical protein
MNRAVKLLFLPVIVAQAAFFLYVSQHRLIDADEGFYLLASRLILQHKTPYLDFFYTQAPLLPYVYGAWIKLFGTSWVAGRILAAMLTTTLGALLYVHVCLETGSWIAGVASTIVFASSSLVFAWLPIVKVFSLALVFLFASYVILAGMSSDTPQWLIALAGVLAGLSADTRSYVIIVFPVLLWWVYRRSQPQPLKRLTYFCGGLVLGLSPSLALFLASPSAFLFNNLEYHAMRSGEGLIANWSNKGETVKALFFGSHTGVQFSLLCLACLAMVWSRRRPQGSSWLALAIAIVLGIMSLMPSPAEVQYFSAIVPFLIVAAVCFVYDHIASLPTPKVMQLGCATAAVLLVTFVAGGIPSFWRYLYTGETVPGIRFQSAAPNWTLRGVTAVSDALDQVASPRQEVASFWPGYIFASHADPYPGFENDFGMYVGRRLSEEQRLEYHILSPPEMIEIFEHHGPGLAIVGNQGRQSGGPDASAAKGVLEMYHYSLVRKVGNTAIYKCCTQP